MRSTPGLMLVLVLAACGPLLAGEEEAGILNATSPGPGILFGGQPTEAQLQALAADHYKTVIDLRGPTENRGYDESAVARAAGLEYVPIPVTGETLQETETFDHFIQVFRDSEKPVLVHCASGGRVAALYYAWLVAEKKMSREDALANAREQGLHGDRLVGPVDHYLDAKGE
jgi:uncharacterized protein (TIGR01244 family)